MFWYVTASLTPAVLLALACFFGGIFPALGVLSITVVVFFMDKLARHLPQTNATGSGLSYVLAAAHLGLLPLGVWALSQAPHLSVLDKVLIFTGLGLFFGQISNSNAHELIHSARRRARRTGILIYITLLHGHHVSAHLRVHHVHAATDRDPNSAPMGEGFWRYCARATHGEFVAGLHADTAQRSRLAQDPFPLTHPYFAYVAGGLLALLFSYALAGTKGVIAHLAIATYAQLQLLLSDYVQHYGLRRRILENGKPEPIGPQHSWNAPTWYSSAMMLNAPKHSDHHMHPARSFPALQVTRGTMPILPHSLPVMAVLALMPPLWRRLMDKRAARWQDAA
jgi:alkane 1-monooxygenase